MDNPFASPQVVSARTVGPTPTVRPRFVFPLWLFAPLAFCATLAVRNHHGFEGRVWPWPRELAPYLALGALHASWGLGMTAMLVVFVHKIVNGIGYRGRIVADRKCHSASQFQPLIGTAGAEPTPATPRRIG